MAHASLRTTTALATALVASLAVAQTPPINPGLWEIRSERQIDGGAATPPARAIKDMKSDVRVRVEAMMKLKGMAGSGGANRVCFTKDTLNASRWQNSASCKTDYGTRTASAWRWRSQCDSSGASVEGEAMFANPENYTVSTTSTHAFRGETKTMETTTRAHWLGADCVDVKPIDPKR